MVDFDYAAIQRAAEEQILAALRDVREKYPDEHIYAAIYGLFYLDGDNAYWPQLRIATEESLDIVDPEYRQESRWCWNDYYGDGEFLPHHYEPTDALESLSQQWADATVHLSDEDDPQWDKEAAKYLGIFPAALKAAKVRAFEEGLVEEGFIVLANDDDGELIRQSLTREELRACFPEIAAMQEEEERVATLPQSQRLPLLVDYAISDQYDQAIGSERAEEMLWEDPDDSPVIAALLVEVLNGQRTGEKDRALRLAAYNRYSMPELVAALSECAANKSAKDYERNWAANALANLGHMDIVAQGYGSLPDSVIQKILYPYTAFREYGHRAPLDFRPLEQLLEDYPHVEQVLLKANYSEGRALPDEHAEAQRGLKSQWAVIRKIAEEMLR
ncbi:MAG: DUF4303 domain-containing protein [Actinomycetaceae bacterium]|nr:DUF4303 domain-containing protein [Actinomycetaceae bacterium]